MNKTRMILSATGLIAVGYLGANLNWIHPSTKADVPTVEALKGVSHPTLHSNVAYALSLDRGFADLVKKVTPGVVNISTYVRQSRPPMYGGPGGPGGMYNDDLFRRFFEEFFGGRMGPQGPNGQMPYGDNDDGDDDGQPPMPPQHRASPGMKTVPLALGSGFVIDADEGLILTNYHVIDGADEVKVQFSEDDPDQVPTEIIGRDPELDVALLKVKTQKKKLTAIPLGDSDKIDVGEYVIAIGNPFNYGHTVSHGILSAKGRKNPNFRLGRYLQTDASINPGNSGGPLVNMRGEVIGINNAIDARAHGIGFAIPINLVKGVLAQLKTKGSVTRGYLGVSAATLKPELAKQLKLDPNLRGVIVSDVMHGQPADKAGLKPYDVITTVNGQKVADAQDLTAKITSVPVGNTVTLNYVRHGQEKTAKVAVGTRPVNGIAAQQGRSGRATPQDGRTISVDDYGFRAQEMSAQTANSVGIPLDQPRGVIVVDLSYGGPAAAAGLNRGDVILDVAGKSVKSVTDLQKALKNTKGNSIVLRVKRYDQTGSAFVSVVVLNKG